MIADLIRLPELFAAVNLLTDRYCHHAAEMPAGVAVARAAIDWQRAGMPPGPIDEPVLRTLAALTLAEISPNRHLDDQAFRQGLDRATSEVAAFAALVRREPSGHSQLSTQVTQAIQIASIGNTASIHDGQHARLCQAFFRAPVKPSYAMVN